MKWLTVEGRQRLAAALRRGVPREAGRVAVTAVLVVLLLGDLGEACRAELRALLVLFA